jgi:hypothetical protein
VDSGGAVRLEGKSRTIAIHRCSLMTYVQIPALGKAQGNLSGLFACRIVVSYEQGGLEIRIESSLR